MVRALRGRARLGVRPYRAHTGAEPGLSARVTRRTHGENDAPSSLQVGGDPVNHNCRPRGFRRSGESACVTEGEEAEGELDYARTFAKPERRRALKLPAIDSSRISFGARRARVRRGGARLRSA